MTMPDSRIFDWERYAPTAAEDVLWDAVIVGGGMGGGFMALALAQAGLKVLVLERGAPTDPFDGGPRPSRLQRLLADETASAALRAKGRWHQKVRVRLTSNSGDRFLPLGSGPGGSSAIYAATLERFLREEFDAVGPGSVTPAPLPSRWPVAYDDFLPYYRRAEAVLRVSGERDRTNPDDDATLNPPPPMSPRDEEFFRIFEDAGLKPHRMHQGCDFRPGCHECIGQICPRGCKADGASRALGPALAGQGAKLLTDFEVERLEAPDGRVEAVHGRLAGVPLTVRGRVVVLAAGALSSPLVLLRSGSPAWPNGLGNRSGLVGRGLMFHFIQIFALWSSRPLPLGGPGKTLSTRALNSVDGRRLGSVQTFSPKLDVGQIAQFMLGEIEARIRFAGPAVKALARVMGGIGAAIYKDAALFCANTEDFAYPDNRVELDAESPSGFSIVYASPPDLRERANLLRQTLTRRLAGARVMFATRGETPNFGHPAGTCRMGEDPQDSVVDRDCRVWGVENLYVADASVMPSIASTNPSLTVAANALRVADVILARSDLRLEAAGAGGRPARPMGRTPERARD